MKLQFEGKEDEIMKNIELGNVTMPLNSSLIQGSQSLFGIKTEMQFGKLKIQTVLSQQKSESKTIELSGGVQTKEIYVNADEYEDNRHFFLAQYFQIIIIEDYKALHLFFLLLILRKLKFG